MTIKLKDMTFNNPWGKGSKTYDLWFNSAETDVTATPALTTDVITGENAVSQMNALMSFAQKPVSDFPNQAVQEVVSLQMKFHKDTVLRGKVDAVRGKLNERDKRLAEGTTMARNQGQKDVIARMTNRFSIFASIIRKPDYDPAEGPFTFSDQDIVDEKNDISTLQNDGNMGSVPVVCQQFLNLIDEYHKQRDIYWKEKEEYGRFDGLFFNADVQTLVESIPNANFTLGDIKALISQESSDLTNKALAGIEDKVAGIVVNSKNTICTSCIGIAQMMPDARDEAISWALKKKVTIPSSPDPRTIPLESIKLVAAYLGKVVEDYLVPRLPQNIPTGVEFKKVAFASYNAGAGTILQGAKQFVGNTAKEYDWSDLETTKAIKNGVGQPIEYVEGIVERSTLDDEYYY